MLAIFAHEIDGGLDRPLLAIQRQTISPLLTKAAGADLLPAIRTKKNPPRLVPGRAVVTRFGIAAALLLDDEEIRGGQLQVLVQSREPDSRCRSGAVRIVGEGAGLRIIDDAVVCIPRRRVLHEGTGSERACK